MKKVLIIWVVILFFTNHGFSNVRRAGMGMGWFRGGHQSFHERHRQFMFWGIPPKYQGKINPLKNSLEVIKSGRERFIAACSSCHGVKGDGNGPAGVSLNPRPSNLIFTMGTHIAQDDFLFWTISEGGTQFKTGMLPFKDVLKEEEIWSIISYLRTLNNF